MNNNNFLNIRFIGFDSPLVDNYFEERYKILLENIPLSHPILVPHFFVPK